MKKNIFNNVLNGWPGTPCGYLKLISVCCLLSVAGCKARKQALVKKAAADTVAVSKPADNKLLKLDAIRLAQSNFNTFNGKARAKLDLGSSSNDVTLNIRVKKGKKIWVSITAIAGIEVARALITSDSILVINRLQGLYLKKPFSYIYAYAGNKVNYSMIESLLIGNIVPGLLNSGTSVQPGASNTLVSGSFQGLVYKLVLGPDLKASQTNLNSEDGGQSLQVNNSNFSQVDNRIVPLQIDMLSIVKDKKIQVNLRYVKTEFDQVLDYPFTIPSRYDPAN